MLVVGLYLLTLGTMFGFYKIGYYAGAKNALDVMLQEFERTVKEKKK